VTGLPLLRRHNDSIWVIIDRLTKSVHFLLVHTSYITDDYAKLYIQELFRMHGVSFSIFSNRGTKFTSQFWKAFQNGLSNQFLLGSSFHPQTDTQAERSI